MKKIIFFFIFLIFSFNLIFSAKQNKSIDNFENPTKFGGSYKITFDISNRSNLVNFGVSVKKSLSPFYTIPIRKNDGFLKSQICNLNLNKNNKINANWNFLNPKLKAWETFLLSKNANSNSESLGKKILENNFWMNAKVIYKIQNQEKSINILVDLDGLEYKDILEKIFKKEKNAQKITLINITPIDKKCSNNFDGENFNFLNFTKQNNFILTNNNSKIFFADNTKEKDKIVKEKGNYKLNNELLDLTKQTFKVNSKTNANNDGAKIYGVSDTFFLFHKIKNLDEKVETEKFINETLDLTKNHDIQKTVKSIENNRFEITYKISGKQKGRAYLFIPKISVPSTQDISFRDRTFQVIDKDPLIAWDYSKGDFTYEAENPEGLVLIVKEKNTENNATVTFSKNGCKTGDAHLFNLDNLTGSKVYNTKTNKTYSACVSHNIYSLSGNTKYKNNISIKVVENKNYTLSSVTNKSLLKMSVNRNSGVCLGSYGKIIFYTGSGIF